MNDPVLDISDLSVQIARQGQVVWVIKGLDLQIARGETLALLGESGSGKTMVALTVMRLLPSAARIVSGRIALRGTDLLSLPERAVQRIRGGRVAIIFQEPQAALNPVLPIGRQIAEAVRRYDAVRRSDRVRARVVDLLDEVGLADPTSRCDDYPHQLSGGMKQRAMIAMALAGRPELLIADEPTTALDVTLQAEILALLQCLQQRHGMAMLLITHDFGVAAKTADRLAVMCAGRLLETAPTATFLAAPGHPYSRRLLASRPGLMRQTRRCIASQARAASQTLLEVADLVIDFPMRRVAGQVRAVDGVSLALSSGQTLALVGESGCGKTTLGKGLAQLLPATAGTVRFRGQALAAAELSKVRHLRKELQIIFQDPYASMNPRMRVGDIIAEGLVTLGLERRRDGRRRRVAELLNRVGLSSEQAARYPHELSGGQRQRIAIARALAVAPRLVVCDEPTSALDVSVQAQILGLLQKLQREDGMAYVLITHDLALVAQIADQVAVMYLGKIVEQGLAGEVLEEPQHPYTQALLSAMPTIDSAEPRPMKVLAGDRPSPADPPRGCRFHPRCPEARAACAAAQPREVALSAEGTRCVPYLALTTLRSLGK